MTGAFQLSSIAPRSPLGRIRDVGYSGSLSTRVLPKTVSAK
jgi:hypothetical protein